jgi:hypothetical protein
LLRNHKPGVITGLRHDMSSTRVNACAARDPVIHLFARGWIAGVGPAMTRVGWTDVESCSGGDRAYSPGV